MYHTTSCKIFQKIFFKSHTFNMLSPIIPIKTKTMVIPNIPAMPVNVSLLICLSGKSKVQSLYHATT